MKQDAKFMFEMVRAVGDKIFIHHRRKGRSYHLPEHNLTGRICEKQASSF